MIWFDNTKVARVSHHSGLMRVSTQLQQRLGAEVTSVVSLDWVGQATTGDWFITADIFTPTERPGWADLLDQRPCRLAAIFHDAIPLKFPQITWPQSVARHPAYMKMLARFDRVWAVSESSRNELLGYWQWLGVKTQPSVEVLALGADFSTYSRTLTPRHNPARKLLCVGIFEPRKNQTFLLDVCEKLWEGGLDFELHLVGRVNPHFGRPILARVKQLQKRRAGLSYHDAASDSTLEQLFQHTRATVFPTIAEGCGLPVIESLWRGVPCVCTNLPVLMENAIGGGCVFAAKNDLLAWSEALHRMLTDDAYHDQLSLEATTRPLVTWQDAANAIAVGLKG